MAIPLHDISRGGISRALRRIADAPVYLSRRRRRVPRPIGGMAGPVEVQCVIVVGFTYERYGFIVLPLDEDGEPVGDPDEDMFPVNAVSYDPLIPGLMGMFDLAECDPMLEEGSILRIVRQRLWRGSQGAGDWIDDWWTHDVFMRTGCA